MNRKRNIYLAMKPLEEARALFLQRFPLASMLGAERVDVAEAVGRTLAEPVFARLSSPSYPAAAMDGVAVRAADTYGASEQRPVELRVPEQACWVNTGDVISEGRDAVVMVERVREAGEGKVAVEVAAHPWQHVRRVGEDIVATEMLFPRHHLVGPTCLGALLLGGVSSLAVKRRPRVLVQPTGAEIVTPSEEAIAALRPGQILDCNSSVLGALVESCGALATRGRPMPDDPEQLASHLRASLEGDFDVVLVIGGSSAGAGDFTRAAIAAAGEVLVHGITMMPGKPTVLGAVAGKPVVGIPGYPVSAILAFEQLVRPLLLRMLSRPEEPPVCVTAAPSRKLASKLGMEEFLRVRLGRVGADLVATPLPRGAGSVTSITQADAIVRIAPDLEGVPAGAPITAELLRPLSLIEQSIVCVGSHDSCLDLLDDELRQRHPGMRLCSSHVGSMGGLVALGRGACHLAGSHLLDPSDGSYNLSYLRKHLPGVPVRIIHLAMRQQGLMVAAGNPKDIQALAELARPGVRFVNRQGGSGTRLLLDTQLAALGIDAGRIDGYRLEELTHMAVAVAVASGAADAGLGVLSAARALGLDFVPVVEEQYDLLIPARFFDTAPLRALVDTVRSATFQARVKALGGYGTARTGIELAV